MQTQWSYEPFGQPTLSGTQSSFPFLFGGGQYDPTGYYGDYSPRLAHSLSGGGEPYTGGGAEPGGGRGHRKHGARGGRPRSLVEAAAVSREDGESVLQDGGGCPLGDCAGGTSSGSGGENGAGVVAIISQIVEDFVNFLEDLFGGGGGGAQPSLRPYDLAATHQPEAHQIGIIASLAPDQSRLRYPMVNFPGGDPLGQEGGGGGGGGGAVEVPEGAVGEGGGAPEELAPSVGKPAPPVNKGNLKVLSKSQLKGVDAEKFKQDILGRGAGGKFNIAVGPNGEVFLVPVTPGAAPPVPAGLTVEDLVNIYGH